MTSRSQMNMSQQKIRLMATNHMLSTIEITSATYAHFIYLLEYLIRYQFSQLSVHIRVLQPYKIYYSESTRSPKMTVPDLDCRQNWNISNLMDEHSKDYWYSINSLPEFHTKTMIWTILWLTKKAVVIAIIMFAV